MTTPKDLASCNYVRIEIQLVIKHGCRKQRHDVQHAEYMQSMQQTVLGMQNTVLNLVAEKKNKAKDNSLDTAMAVILQQVSEQHSSGQGPTVRSSDGYNLPQSKYGIPSDCIPHLDVVTDKLRKKLWEGKDVNLAQI